MVYQFRRISQQGSSSISSSNINNNNNEQQWGLNNRNIETYLTRLSSRLDQLVLRFDHLDSRINRFTSLIQGRLDGVENSLSSTKIKMDVWGEEMSRMDEQLSRKWKNIESKFELIVPTIDSKLENKLTMIQRDNRRQSEHLSSLILGIGQRVDLKTATIFDMISNLNTTLLTSCEPQVLSTPQPIKFESTPSSNTTKLNIYDENSLISIIQSFSNRSEEILKSNNALSHIGTKVTNMFEDLIERSNAVQGDLKESLFLSNVTREELHEHFRILSQNGRRGSSLSSMSSSETMSAVVVEALTSVESMSNALGRRVSELRTSIEERFEIVSMTLNGFLESCLRIQEGAPLVEDHIAAVLEKILDTFQNSSRSTEEDLYGISTKLDFLLFSNRTDEISPNQSIAKIFPPPANKSVKISPFSANQSSVQIFPVAKNDSQLERTAELLKNSQVISDDDKKFLWESLFPNHEVPD